MGEPPGSPPGPPAVHSSISFSCQRVWAQRSHFSQLRPRPGAEPRASGLPSTLQVPGPAGAHHWSSWAESPGTASRLPPPVSVGSVGSWVAWSQPFLVTTSSSREERRSGTGKGQGRREGGRIQVQKDCLLPAKNFSGARSQADKRVSDRLSCPRPKKERRAGKEGGPGSWEKRI